MSELDRRPRSMTSLTALFWLLDGRAAFLSSAASRTLALFAGGWFGDMPLLILLCRFLFLAATVEWGLLFGTCTFRLFIGLLSTNDEPVADFANTSFRESTSSTGDINVLLIFDDGMTFPPTMRSQLSYCWCCFGPRILQFLSAVFVSPVRGRYTGFVVCAGFGCGLALFWPKSPAFALLFDINLARCPMPTRVF